MRKLPHLIYLLKIDFSLLIVKTKCIREKKLTLSVENLENIGKSEERSKKKKNTHSECHMKER